MVLYTYPADFTFVCASELVAFSKLQKATTTESNPQPGLRVKKLLCWFLGEGRLRLRLKVSRCGGRRSLCDIIRNRMLHPASKMGLSFVWGLQPFNAVRPWIE